MPNGGRSGEEEKIILNGGDAAIISRANAELLDKLCTSIYDYTEDHHFPDAPALVLLANEIEDLTFKVQRKIFKFRRAFLEQQGFQGPWPESMQ